MPGHIPHTSRLASLLGSVADLPLLLRPVVGIRVSPEPFIAAFFRLLSRLRACVFIKYRGFIIDARATWG
jgi:hypothetical protein